MTNKLMLGSDFVVLTFLNSTFHGNVLLLIYARTMINSYIGHNCIIIQQNTLKKYTKEILKRTCIYTYFFLLNSVLEIARNTLGNDIVLVIIQVILGLVFFMI